MGLFNLVICAYLEFMSGSDQIYSFFEYTSSTTMRTSYENAFRASRCFVYELCGALNRGRSHHPLTPDMARLSLAQSQRSSSSARKLPGTLLRVLHHRHVNDRWLIWHQLPVPKRGGRFSTKVHSYKTICAMRWHCLPKLRARLQQKRPLNRPLLICSV